MELIGKVNFFRSSLSPQTYYVTGPAHLLYKALCSYFMLLKLLSEFLSYLPSFPLEEHFRQYKLIPEKSYTSNGVFLCQVFCKAGDEIQKVPFSFWLLLFSFIPSLFIAFPFKNATLK